MPHARCAVTVLLALFAGGCVIPQRDAAREALDPETGTTVTAMGTTLEFYSPRPELGLQAASFAHLGALESNRMGARRLLLWLSVLPGGTAQAPLREQDAPTALTLIVDSAQIEPSFVSNDASALGLSRAPFKRPAEWARDAYFDVDMDVLRQLQGAGSLKLLVTSADGQLQSYELWKPDRSSLARFIDKIAPP